MDHHCDQFPISLIQDNCIKTHQHISYIEDYDELLSKITLTRTNRPSVGLYSSPRPSPLLRFLRFLSRLFFLLSIFLSIFLPFPFPQIYSSFVFIMFLLFLLVFKLIFYSSHIETLCPLATSSHISPTQFFKFLDLTTNLCKRCPTSLPNAAPDKRDGTNMPVRTEYQV